MSDTDDDLDFDRTIQDAEKTLSQLEDMMKVQQDKMDALFKKTLIYSILWCIITAVVYFVWPDKWYFWIPAISAVLYILSFIFVIVMRKKLNRTIAQGD